MDLDKQFSTILKKERIKRKLSQREVASIIGISRSYYSDIENGRRIPSGKMLFKINKVLPIFFTKYDADRVRLLGGVKNETRDSRA